MKGDGTILTYRGRFGEVQFETLMAAPALINQAKCKFYLMEILIKYLLETGIDQEPNPCG